MTRAGAYTEDPINTRMIGKPKLNPTRNSEEADPCRFQLNASVVRWIRMPQPLWNEWLVEGTRLGLAPLSSGE
jgi:hypothetical protein